MDNQKDFAAWLNSHYEAWLGQEPDGGSSNTLTTWQHYLDIDENLLSRWLGGKAVPTNRSEIEKLAAKLGDDVYEVLGLPKSPNK